MIIDTHAHLNWESYQKDLGQVIDRAKQHDVGKIINIGVDLKSSQDVINQASHINKIEVLATIGIHPHEAHNYSTAESLKQAIANLKVLYQTNTPKIVAIGECGLDYHFEGNFDYIPSSFSKAQLIQFQKQLYQAQVDLAKSLNLPLVIHCRNSKSETNLPPAWFDIFLDSLKNTRGVFHNFSGSFEDAQKALDLGYCLSFSCIITYPKNQHLRDLIKNLPLDKILAETDCPFLPPQQIRGQRNEPFYVAEVIKTIAEVKSLSFDQVASSTANNAKTLFNLK